MEQNNYASNITYIYHCIIIEKSNHANGISRLHSYNVHAHTMSFYVVDKIIFIYSSFKYIIYIQIYIISM